MAEVAWGQLSSARKKVWSADVWMHARDTSFWWASKMVGRGTADTTNVLHYVTELTATEKGDKCVMHLIPDLVSDGVPGDMELEGREKGLTAEPLEITIDQLREAVKNEGVMAAQRHVFRFRIHARDVLSNWYSQITDEMTFLVAAGIAFTKNVNGGNRHPGSLLNNLAFAADVTAPTSKRKAFAYNATAITATTGLAATDKMSWETLTHAKAMAARSRIKPVMRNGRRTYVVVMSVEQARDLRNDASYRSIVSNAGTRGPENPLFRGQFADVEDLVLFEHPKVPNTLSAASGSKYGSSGTVEGAQALLLGAQAIGYARIGDPQWVEKGDLDYENKAAVAYGGKGLFGLKKAVFTAPYNDNTTEDFSVLSIYTAAR